MSSTITGDRLCTGCGFNLIGQPIVRDDTHDLLIVRCSECGVVAALQEYPLTGPWLRRWTAFLGASWMLIFVGSVLIMSLLGLGAAHGMAGFASTPVAKEIAAAYFDDAATRIRSGAALTSTADKDVESRLHYVQTSLTEGTAQTQGLNPFQPAPVATGDPAAITDEAVERTRQQFVNEWAGVDSGWWQAQTSRDFITSDGLLDVALHVPFPFWFFFTLIAAFYGVMLSVMLLHRRRRVLPVYALAPLGLALIFMLVSAPRPQLWWGAVGMPARSIASLEIWLAIVTLVTLIGAGALCAGLLLGRSFARIVLAATLPPRLRGALSAMWTCDGLTPPRTIPPGRRS